MSDVKFGRSVAPHERKAVAWYQPGVLWTAAREVLSSLDQLRNQDLRETYELPLTVIDRSKVTGADDFWFDFIADTGDGGNATCAVAHAALGDSVPGKPGAADKELLRGELLLFGGDLAYPGASPDEYRWRFIEMFEGARRDAGTGTGTSQVRGRPFTLAALAQNHDWMDSASTFSRYFIRNKTPPTFLGAAIPQKQSYFCVKLPQGWWAFGFDFALAHDIDRDQYEQFEKLVTGPGLQCTEGGITTTHKLGPDDRVLMIYPEPFWTRPLGDGAEPNRPRRYQRLEGLLRKRIAARLAGDLHHYLRWESKSDGMLVTCGSGGAFTHPTHTKATTRPILLRTLDTADAVPREPGPAVVVGQDDGKQPERSVAFSRVEASAYPNAPTSRRRATENILAFFKTDGSWRGGNWWFAALLGGLYWFNAYLNSLPFIDSFRPDGFRPMWAMAPSAHGDAFVLWLKAMIFSPMGFVINVLMVGGCMVMGRAAVDELSPRASRLWRWVVTWGIGFVHASLHVVAVFSLVFWLQQGVGLLPYIGHPAHADPWAAIGHAVAVGVGMLVGGAIVGSLIFGTYLALMSRLGYLTNNGYSALGIEDYKGFLRFRITAQGRLDGWFIGIDRVPRNWETSPRGQAPVWQPNDPQATVPRVHDSFTL